MRPALASEKKGRNGVCAKAETGFHFPWGRLTPKGYAMGIASRKSLKPSDASPSERPAQSHATDGSGSGFTGAGKETRRRKPPKTRTTQKACSTSHRGLALRGEQISADGVVIWRPESPRREGST